MSAAVVDLGEYRRAKTRASVDVDGLIRRLDHLRGERANWDSHRREVARRIWPQADEFLGRDKSTRQMGGGDKRMQDIYDATGALALERFAAFMESINTPRHDVWHSLRASNQELNKDASVKRWFEAVNDILWNERQRWRARFQPQMSEGYKSLGAFGDIPLYTDENPSGGLRYRYCHVNQLFVDTAHTGQIDTVFRVFELTARQAQQRWGTAAGERVGAAVRGGKPDQSFEFLHAVYPRRDVDPDSFGTDRFPWQSVYLGIDGKHLIEEDGYEEMPYHYGRWTVNPSEKYGRSVAMMAFPHIKLANEIQKSFIGAAHRTLIPPLLAPDEGTWTAGGRSIDIRPGGIIYGGVDPSTGKPLLQPLNSGSNLALTEQMVDTERKVINDWFYVSVFQAILEDPKANVTATYWLQRAQEKGDLVAPPSGRLQSELFGPMIDRELGLLQRQGRLPPPPPVLLEAEGEYDIEYVNEAQRLQSSRKVMGIRSTIELATALAPLDPRAAKKIKMDEAIEIVADYEGVPSELVRTNEEVDALMQAEQQAQQQAQALAMFQQGAAGAKDATAALQQAAQAGAIRQESASGAA